MRRNRAISLMLAVGWSLAAASGTVAAEPKQIGVFKAWSAHRVGAGKQLLCYVYAVPGQSRGKYKRRGPTYIQVTHRAKDGARNEVSVMAGYAYKPDSEAIVDIDGRKFKLFTQGDGAWTRGGKQDAALVAAMRAGKTMILRGTSSRGTRTTDTYSLKGFTVAHNAIGKACGIR